MKVVQEVNIWAFLLTIENIRFSGILLHNLSLRQVMQEVDEYQMKFHLGNKLVHFLIREWCLATRLKCVELEGGRKIGNFGGNDDFLLEELVKRFEASQF